MKISPRTPASSKTVPPPLPLKILDVIEKREILENTGKKGVKRIVLETPLEVPKNLGLHTKGIGMSKAFLTKLRNLPGNDKCCDCGVAHPQWASINLSSLVCIKCAGAHRSLGVVKSRIKSLELDSWSAPQIARMFAGGNTRLQVALKSDSARWTVVGEPFSIYTAHARYDSEDADAYTCALDYKCGQLCEDEDEDDDDEAPGFGEFLVEQEWQLQTAGAKFVSPCVDISRATENATGMFSCIGNSFSCLFKSFVRSSGEQN